MSRAKTILAGLLVWFGLVVPDQFVRLTPVALVRLPAEILLILLVGLLVPARPARVVGWVAGVGVGGLLVFKIITALCFVVLGRPFNPDTDGSYLGSGYGVVQHAVGPARAAAAAGAGVLLILVVVVLATASTLRLISAAARHQGPAGRGVAVLTAVWLLCAVLGIQAGGGRVAATSASGFSLRTAAPQLTAIDAFAATPGDELLRGLRGHDVLIVFVESYGRVAGEDPQVSPPVLAALDRGDQRIRGAGFAARSGMLTSSTYAGLSWLAHATLQSGQWISDQGRYDELLAGERLTLSGAFGRAGWRTVAAIPANTMDWPEGMRFYGYDHIYDSRNLGYAGPAFGYATMPDQYLLSSFQRAELAHDHPPVMAELDLVSSHGPWGPLAPAVGWSQVGDGSIYSSRPPALAMPEGGWRRADQTKAAYAQSIAYTLDTLTSFVATYGNDDLVLVVLGDHQPASVVSGPDASHDVPISIIARDPAVLDRVEPWGWSDGLRPALDAPVWGMDTFRDRFLTAYGSE